jgi:hypothetical protein
MCEEIPVNKVVDKKKLEKGAEEEERLTGGKPKI